MKRTKKSAALGTRMRGKLQKAYGKRGKKNAQLFLTRSLSANTDVSLVGQLQYLNYLLCESDPSISYTDYTVPDFLEYLGVMAIAYTDEATMQIRVLRHEKNQTTTLLDEQIETYAEACRSQAPGRTPHYRNVEVVYLNQSLLSSPKDHIRLQNWNALIPAAAQAKFYPSEIEHCKDLITAFISSAGAATVAELMELACGDESKKGLLLAAIVDGVAKGQWKSDFADQPFTEQSCIMTSLSYETRKVEVSGGEDPAALQQATFEFDESLPPRDDSMSSLKELDTVSAALNRVVYAKAENISVKDCPLHWRDSKNWPPFDFEAVKSGMPESKWAVFEKFRFGVQRYLDTLTLKKGAAAAGCAESTLLAKFRKCLRVAVGGSSIWGWGALIPGARGGTYESRAEPPSIVNARDGAATKDSSHAVNRGPAGKFRALLRNHPEILEELICAIEVEQRPDEPAISNQTLGGVYNSFIRACRAAKLSTEEEPRANAYRRSVENFVHEYLDGHLGCFGRWFGEGTVSQLEVGTGKRSFQLAVNPYDLVMMDAHKVDVQGTVWIRTPDGYKRVPVSRLWLIALYCFKSRALLGFSVSYGAQVAAEAIEEAFLSATTSWKKRALVDGMRYDLGAGLPYGMVKGLVGCPIVMFRMDNFSSHYSHVIDKLRQIFGFSLNYGAVGKWFTNAPLERLFETLEAAGLHVLSSSMGSGPSDPLRPKNPGRVAVENGVDDQFLRDKIEKIVTGENARASSARSGMTPLEIIQNHIEKKCWFPRPIIQAHGSCPRIGWREKRAIIRGHQKPGNVRRPYFELHGTHYSNPEIANSFHLIGTTILTYTRILDSAVEASFLDGTPIIGLVQISGGRKSSPAPVRLQVTRELYNSKNKPHSPLEEAAVGYEQELENAAAARALTHPYAVNEAATRLAELRRKRQAAAAFVPPQAAENRPRSDPVASSDEPPEAMDPYNEVVMPGQRKVSFMRVDSRVTKK